MVAKYQGNNIEHNDFMNDETKVGINLLDKLEIGSLFHKISIKENGIH